MRPTPQQRQPAALARWLDTLDLAPGERLLHVGCGVGYYTAIGAEQFLETAASLRGDRP